MWITHPVRLAGKLVRLEPLSNAHIPELVAIGGDATIWTHLPFDGTDPEKLKQELGSAILNRAHGSQYPFTIFRQSDDKIIGSTRFFEMFPEHKKLEIGWTWYAREVWGQGLNIECKLLLLTYCFETLLLNRVQLKTRETNQRSQAAIAKIGASFEGKLRRDRVMPNGEVRDTVVYSIILEEWPQVKRRLEEMMAGLG